MKQYRMLYEGTNSDYFERISTRYGSYTRISGLEKCFLLGLRWQEDTRKQLATAFPEEYSSKAYEAEFCVGVSEKEDEVWVDLTLVLPGVPRTTIAHLHVILREFHPYL